MQNNQNFFLLSVSQPPGRGWSSRLGQNPKFVKGNIFGAPLIVGEQSKSKMSAKWAKVLKYQFVDQVCQQWKQGIKNLVCFCRSSPLFVFRLFQLLGKSLENKVCHLEQPFLKIFILFIFTWLCVTLSLVCTLILTFACYSAQWVKPCWKLGIL